MTITATKIFSNIVISSFCRWKNWGAERLTCLMLPRKSTVNTFLESKCLSPLFKFCFSLCFLFTIQFPSYPLLAPLQFLCKPGSFVYTQFYWSLLSSMQLCHVCFSVSLSTVVFTWLSWSILWTLIVCVVSLLQTLLSFLCIYSFYLFFSFCNYVLLETARHHCIPTITCSPVMLEW